ncbi:hypothetical protein NDU88_005511 [Pleurodeles waltl]|uniref:Uncharacterized protein n=1 Tax=Pleurodeles waltl TaxID=8319 RepID=A0AAV7NP86_PLEWA|nr:hypothetical protein NDU88_005511 [Pleurodeles waltl]
MRRVNNGELRLQSDWFGWIGSQWRSVLCHCIRVHEKQEGRQDVRAPGSCPVQGHQGTAVAHQHNRIAMRPLCNLGRSRGVDAVTPTPTPAPAGGAASEAREYWHQGPGVDRDPRQ